MKYLLTLILVCTLLCGCAQAPMLTTSIPLGSAEIPPEATLPGDVIGTPIPTGDGRKLFYIAGTQLRVWDQQRNIHRRIRDLSGSQRLTDVLLDGAILQCTAEEDGRSKTYFYSASDGQLLKIFDGEIRVETGKDGFSATIPVGDLTVCVFGPYNTQPRMCLGNQSNAEAEPYYSSEDPDTAGLEDCREAASQITEAYGLQVCLWDEVRTDTPLTGEHLVPVIRRELSVLSQRLSVFPEEILRETTGHFTALNLCLVRNRLHTIPCPQFREGKTMCIVLESGRSGQELYHGLFHAMETHILGNSKALDRWNDLNPAGFAYDEDYTANAARDSGIYLQGELRAFPNQFSMSFPREDRAEIFAHAMMPGNTVLFQSEIMQTKLSVLCSGIREAFDLENYKGILPWEQYLD